MANDRAELKWDDPFLLDEQLTEEERLIRDTAREYAQDKLMSRVREANRHEHFHREIMNEFGALGMLGATLPANSASRPGTSANSGAACDGSMRALMMWCSGPPFSPPSSLK